MSVFLSTSGETYSYDQLVYSINNNQEYYPCFQTGNLFSFFENLIKSIITGNSLVMIDSTLQISEIQNMNIGEVNKSVKLRYPFLNSVDEIIKLFQKSETKITIFTSGTTGQPKKVIHSIPSLSRFVRIGAKYNNQIWAFAYNPTHIAGLQVFLQAFENKNTIVNVFNDSRSVVYKKIERNNITNISATPTFYRLLLPFEVPYNGVTRVTLGGEKSDAHLYDSIHQIFPNAKINNVYASTEAGSLFAAKGDCFQIPESIADKIIIFDDELLIHRSLIGESESFSFDNDYYHSGDLVEWIDVNERLFRFKSRKNELINVGGYKVNPEEVETAINEIGGVYQSLVYGKYNSVIGNILCADIKLSDHCSLSEYDIRQYLNKQLLDYKIPRRIKFVDSFKLTRTGKIKRL